MVVICVDPFFLKVDLYVYMFICLKEGDISMEVIYYAIDAIEYD
jgi:hypothetical protein